MNHWYKVFLGAVLVCAAVGAHATGITSYLSLAWLQDNVDYLRLQVAQNYWLVVGVYLASYITASCCAIPGSTLFVLAAGLLFGFVYGVIFALTGLVVGATTMFLISRYILGSWVQERYGQRCAVYNQAIEEQGYYYMLLARFFAFFPFGLLNIFAGVTLLPVRTFVVTTAVGMVPHIALYVFVGQQLGAVQAENALFSPPAAVFFCTLILRAGSISYLVRLFVKKRAQG
jgi:uncharacterized membrane protein YdjX (TVP38/TMEM64 family)